ncbi:RNase adapter RapZ [Neisseriaceae bacterium ESL0693]|nr:RNase adapter RapZ [Neisseriaceae bacterium ESL0693]
MRIVLISGLSGSGKSIALRLLEDVGFICVDNLPIELLPPLIHHYQSTGVTQLGVSVDIRSRFRFPELFTLIQTLRLQGHCVDVLFLTATEQVLLRRFSETRRSHPLAKERQTLQESMAAERDYMSALASQAYILDTSLLSASQLRCDVQEWLDLPKVAMHIVLESFGFKFGPPQGLDFVFDVRCLPNPFYDHTLRPYTGLDLPIVDFFIHQPLMQEMIDDIAVFLGRWLPEMEKESRSYVNIGIGCTGGQHRSVYIVESLARKLKDYDVLVRHRQLDGVGDEKPL